MYNLGGKVALVTGAGGKKGLGRAIALRLASEGADVIVNDLVRQSTDPSGWRGIPSVVQEIEALGRRSLGLAADVSDSIQVESMVRQALKRFGHVDILVNNAAAPAGRDRVPVVDLEEDVWDLVQRVNVKGTFLCCRAVARAMIERGQGGKIINMSSISGKVGKPRYAAYAASKFAVRGFTQSLAQELAVHGIQVNAICPILVESERVDKIAAALAPKDIPAQVYRQQFVERVGASAPLGRIAQTTDVANMAAFLASSESDFLTGLAITLAGGAYME
jgi:NAD(P)-dependent dehydrogenase (short-subunit alcohol dehydrogenase family)